MVAQHSMHVTPQQAFEQSTKGFAVNALLSMLHVSPPYRPLLAMALGNLHWCCFPVVVTWRQLRSLCDQGPLPTHVSQPCDQYSNRQMPDVDAGAPAAEPSCVQVGSYMHAMMKSCCRQNQELERYSASMLEDKLRLQEQADSLSQRLEAVLHDKFERKSFDAATPIDKTLAYLQSVIQVQLARLLAASKTDKMH